MARMIHIHLLSFLFLLAGCSPFAMQSIANSMMSLGPSSSLSSTKLMIFSGDGSKIYLGCLNCPDSSSDSVFNSYGTYGSKYSSVSIHNPYGKYGSPYSPFSVCNPYASYPPVVVNGNGRYYGYLTLNVYKSGAITNNKIIAWLQSICAD